VNARICYIEMVNVVLINWYTPTKDNEEEVKNIFYEGLDTVCDLIPTNKVKILLGDLNAKIGQEIVYRPIIGKESLHRDSNDNGTRLVNFAMTRNMVVSSTTFPHKDIHKQTWVSPTAQTKNQIDHGIVDRRFKMETRKNTNRIACINRMHNSQKRRHHGLPELQRNIPVKHILQNINNVLTILLNRIKPYSREIIGESQSRFMPGRSTVNQIHTIKQEVEKSHEFDKDMYLLFVDFRQAYNSIHQNELWKIMIQLGIPAKLVRLIKACVQHSKCKVKFNAELSEEFSVETGLRQGDALSPTSHEIFHIFKHCLGVDINQQANSHEEINRRITGAILLLCQYLSQGYCLKARN